MNKVLGSILLATLGLFLGCGKGNARPESMMNPITAADTGAKEILSSGGTSDTAGGGSVIQFQNQQCPFLLDSLMLHQPLAFAANTLGTDCPTPTESAHIDGIDALDPVSLPAFREARDKLAALKLRLVNENKGHELAMVMHVSHALSGMAFRQTTNHFRILPRYFLPAELAAQNPSVQMAILYLPIYGAIISRPVWDRVSVSVQVGLLYHEALRQIQEAYHYSEMSDQTLQTLTALLKDDLTDHEKFETTAAQVPRLNSVWLQFVESMPRDLHTTIDARTGVVMDSAFHGNQFGYYNSEENETNSEQVGQSEKTLDKTEEALIRQGIIYNR